MENYSQENEQRGAMKTMICLRERKGYSYINGWYGDGCPDREWLELCPLSAPAKSFVNVTPQRY
jgi:hypothetical protein